MNSVKGKQAKIDAAFSRLADLIEYGHLRASADPVGFIDAIADELIELRAENIALRRAVKKENKSRGHQCSIK